MGWYEMDGTSAPKGDTNMPPRWPAFPPSWPYNLLPATACRPGHAQADAPCDEVAAHPQAFALYQGEAPPAWSLPGARSDGQVYCVNSMSIRTP